MKSPWWIVAGALLLAAALLPIDEAASAWMLQPVGERDGMAILRQDQFNFVLGLIFGASPFFFLLFVLVTFPQPVRRAWTYALALVGSALITQTIKVLVGRARPDTDLGSFSFTDDAANQVHGSMQSFPSGHATTAVALGVLLGRYFPRFRYVFWFGAANICLERMVSDRHFLSDVLGGAAIGLLTVWLLLWIFGRDATDLQPGRYPTPATRGLLIWGLTCLGLSVLIFGNAASGGTWDLQVAKNLTSANLKEIYDVAGPAVGGVVGLVLLYAILTSFRNGHALLFGFFTAVISSTIALHAFKTAIGRARPLVEDTGAFAFEPMKFSQTMNSFPSGHTTFNVLLAILLSSYFPRGTIFFFILAGAIMLERVVNQLHWPSDLAGGVALATASYLLCRRVLGDRRYLPESDEGRCVRCGYSLTGLESERCPECGQPTTISA